MKQCTIILLGTVLLLTSCVSQKKYDALEASKNNLQSEFAKLKKAKRDCDEMVKKLTEVEAQYTSLKRAQSELKEKHQNLIAANEELTERYDELLDQNSSILTNSSAEKKNLNEALARKESQIDKKEKELNKVERALRTKEAELDELRNSLNSMQASLEEREMKIANLKDQLNAQRNILTGLKSRLSQALLGFSASDLTVTQKNGKVYVSMSQNLLFAKGSDKIDSKGREAIQKISTVLAQNQDIDITVEGHTDTDGTAERNWDLSVTRATSVINLMSDFGVDPKRLTAAGRAYFAPIAPNDNEANKSKNRRTEIIVSPKLDELFRLLES